MHRAWIAVQVSLLAFLGACSPRPQAPAAAAFYVFRLDPPALVRLSADGSPLRETPMAAPSGCSLGALFPAPQGAGLAIEWDCSFGQTVVLANLATAGFKQAVTDSDSHFLAWSPDGQALYLKLNTVDHPQVLRLHLNGDRDELPITGLTYDLAPAPNGGGFIYSFSRGMGFGSEMDLAPAGGQLALDPQFYLSFARWSPDGKRIAFIKIPDSQTPFSVGELWVMSADGSQARKLAQADSGHGFAPAWSPDGMQIAFVARDNPDDPAADQSASALVSNIHLVNVQTGRETALTEYKSANVSAPVWSPDGKQVAVTIVMNDKMNVMLVDAASGETHPALTAPACCPFWIQE